MSDIHTFDVNVANDVGVNSAIVFQSFCFWIQKNASDQTNFKDGSFWAFASAQKLTTFFPYFSARQIAYAIETLVSNGYLKKAKLCDNKTNRTNWYALDKKGESICQIRSVHSTNLSNGNDKNVECNIEVNEKKISNRRYTSTSLRSVDVSVFSPEVENFVPAPVNKTKPVSTRHTFDSASHLISLGCDSDTVADFIALRKAKKAPVTKTVLSAFMNEAQKAGMTLNDVLQTCCLRGWTGFKAEWVMKDRKQNSSIYEQSMMNAQAAKAMIFGDANATI